MKKTLIVTFSGLLILLSILLLIKNNNLSDKKSPPIEKKISANAVIEKRTDLQEEDRNLRSKTKEQVVEFRSSSEASQKTSSFYQNVLGKDYYSKTEAQLALGRFLSQHPYNNHNFKSVEDWKAIPKRDRPDLAMEQEFLLTLDPATGTIPWEQRQNAYEHTKAILSRKGAISGVNWEERGPDNVAGRTRAMMFDPNDPADKKVWAGGVGGGLWYNDDITDANASWQHIDSFWDNIAISAITYDPSNPLIFYVGTGEGYFNADSARGNGIWKSTDGGLTWIQIANTSNNSNFRYVNDLEVTDTGVVLAGTRSGVYRSTDGGSSWSKTHNDNVMDLEKSKDGDIYVGDRNGQIHKSTDSGLTWSSNIAPSGGVRVEVACAPSNNDIVYAVAHGGSGSNDIQWLVKSTNGGNTWSTLSIPTYQGPTVHFTRGQAWYDLILAVHPTNPDLVVAGGINLHRTTDGGSTWEELSYWYLSPFSPYYAHADQHEILFRPNNSNEAIFGNDGGLSYSTTIGDPTSTPFTPSLQLETRIKDYNVTQFYACAIENNIDANYYLAGSQDNGTHKFENPGMNSTTEVTGGDGGYCFIDQGDPTYQISSYVYNNWRRSTNGGGSFSSITADNSGSFINPADYDSETDILYANRGNNSEIKRVAGISNSTVTNEDISLGLSMSSGTVTHLRVSPYTSNRVFLGVSNGNIYKVDNAHATPTTVEIPTPSLPTGSISCIEIGASDDQLLITFSNYGVSSVWETKDGGTTWTNKEGNLPDMPIRWALYNPNNRQEVLLATEFGVYSTDDLDASPVDWGVSSAGLANTRCTMLKYRESDGQVVVSTHGRGLFTSDAFILTKTYFETTALSVEEETDASADCRKYRDYTFNFNIVKQPTGGNAEVSISRKAGTATEGVDYDITTPMPLVFTPSGSNTIPVTLRVYDDAEVESSETLTLEYTLNAGSSDAIKHTINQEFELSIDDNEAAPGMYNTTLLDEDWSSGDFTTNGWTPDGTNIFVNTTQAGFQWNPAVSNYNQYITSSILDATNGNNVLLDYDLLFTNLNNANVCGVTIEYKKVSEVSWTVLEDFNNTLPELAGPGLEVYNRTDQLLPVDNSQFQIRFYFYGQNSFSLDNIALDNISITAEKESTPSTGIVLVSEYLGPNQVIQISDGTEILASIENLSSHDYGCTTVEIDRTGTGGTTFYNTSNSGRVTDKTFKVVPTNPSPSGNYRIKLYYTDAEITGWESATGNNRNDLNLLKSPDAIADGTIVGSEYGLSPVLGTLGSNYYIEAEFDTGFSGFGGSISGIGGPLDATSLPVTLLNFEANRVAKTKEVKLNWETLAEKDNLGFEIEQSEDGINYKKIGFVDGAGTSSQPLTYEFSTLSTESAYYRLKQIDLDRKATYSTTRFVEGIEVSAFTIFPNPTQGKLSVQLPNSQEVVSMQIFDAKGGLKLLFKGKEEELNSILERKVPHLENGTYIIQIQATKENYRSKFVKQ